jgi:DUF4097 and DUF4098 domain-containing protein YvlB
MPKYSTPQPITADIDIVTGSVRVVASDRDDAVVEVSPRDPNRASDVRVAESARVDFRNGTITVSAGRRFISLGRGGAVVIDIELPSRSRLQVSSASADLRADGVYGDCRFATASGDARVESVIGKVKSDSASGGISVDTLAGEATVSTASGDASFGDLTGDIKFRAASGDLSVRRLQGIVNAQTSSGDVAVSTAVNGEISVQSASGEVEVGVEEGTAARLELRTHSGKVSNGLQTTDGPGEADETLAVNVRTGSGDVTVRRSTVSAI